MVDLKEIEDQSAQAVSELLEVSRLEKGDLFVVGCSSSEVLGEKIGTHTSLDVAEAIYRDRFCAEDARNPACSTVL